MGRIPTFVVIIIGVVLIVGLSALMIFVVLKPQQEQLTDLEQKLDSEKKVAARIEQAEQGLADVTQEWLTKQKELARLMATRSIPISLGHPAAAMVALWYEYREDLPPLIERWVESCGCVIESGVSFPAPEMTPPAPPPGGFMQVPGGQTITLTISGSLVDLERLYRSLNRFPRIVTVGELVMEGVGNNLRARVPLKFYLLCEVPRGVAAAGAGPPEGVGRRGPGMGRRGRGMGPEGEAGPEAPMEEMEEDVAADEVPP